MESAKRLPAAESTEATHLGAAPGAAVVEPVVVRWKYLFAFYLVVPILLVVMFVDYFLLSGQIRGSMVQNPDEWLLFRLFFNLPHIMAGNLLMADKEYAAHYRKSVMIPGLIIALGLFPVISATAGDFYAYLLFDFMTIWHTWQQQVGLNRVLLKEKFNWFRAWGIACFLVVLVAYMQLYATTEVPPLILEYRLGLVLLSAALVAAGVTLAPRASMGRKFIFLNGALTLFAAVTLLFGYPLFAILGYRIIHDITAFYIYSVHDMNRNAEKPHNFMTGFMGKLRVPRSMRLVTLALVLSAGVSVYEYQYWLCEYIIISSSFFHYFAETFVWRGPSLHRKFARFVA